jgi:glutamate-1-semialdehyde aminotransferase
MTKTWNERAKDVLAQGCLVYSKRSDQFVEGAYPTHVTSAHGIRLTTDDGKTYIDLCGGLGSNILNCSNNYTLPHVKEVIFAEMICGRIPFIEKMRIAKNGSDPCQAAVRIARASNKRTIGYGTGYHGSLNWCIAAEKPGAGCVSEGYQKFATIDELMNQLRQAEQPPSYVIVEPVELEYTQERKRQLIELRELCTKRGVVLIFDEVITGFRVPMYCIATAWEIEPDLICFGKPIGNGYPISVVGGRASIMDTPDYFVSYTFAGEESSLDAAIDTIHHLTPDVINELWSRGLWFMDEVNKINPEKIWLVGYPTRFVWSGEAEYKAKFWQQMLDYGVLCGKSMCITLWHDLAILTGIAQKIELAIRAVDAGKVTLRGSLPKEVFKRHEEQK